MAVLLTLLVIASCLALSYGILRSQGTMTAIRANSNLRLSARQAALTGISLGLKKMHGSSWAGVDSTLTGPLGTSSGFQVGFTTGDPSLVSSHPDYGDYPYRVTLLSTGWAEDPGDSDRRATYRVRAVVRLVPRKLADEPTEWASMTTNTLHQYNKSGTVGLAVPFRIQGTIRSYGKWTFPAELRWGDTEKTRYLRDLKLMKDLPGEQDCRPFDSQIALAYSNQPSGLIDLLNTTLGIPTANLTANPASDWAFPGLVSSYRIYPGGKTYPVPTVSQSLWSTALRPDPETNPLGIYYRSGGVDLYDGVTLKGTLVQGTSSGDVRFCGRNVHIQPVDLPAVYPGTQPVQLPVILTKRDLKIESSCQGSLTGLVAAWRRFEIASDYEQSFAVQMACRIVAQDCYIHDRYEWGWLFSWWWSWAYNEFRASGAPYFPSWLKSACGLDYVPKIVIRPDSRAIQYHYPWKNPSNPIYLPHPDDGGLRWDVVDWTDNPSN